MAVEVRDADHSYSITNGDTTREFQLSSGACEKVKPFAANSAQNADIAAVPLPVEDLAASTAAAASSNSGTGNANGNNGNANGVSGNGNGNGNSGNGQRQRRLQHGVRHRLSGDHRRVAAGDRRRVGRERCDLPGRCDGWPPGSRVLRARYPSRSANPTEWSSGAGAIYLTDGDSTVVAAVVAPLGAVQLREFDTGSASWH